MFVFRKEYYLERLRPDDGAGGDKMRAWEDTMQRAKNVAECIIAKQRHGPIGTAILSFNPHLTAFGNLDAEDRARYEG
jgi:replicative DNA helicase